METQLISLDQAAEVAASRGVPMLDKGWWKHQCDRGKMKAAVIRKRRYLRQDRVELVIRRIIDQAT